MPHTSHLIPISHLSPLIDNYDAFILDVWGTLHDGVAIYPGVKECLQQLQRHNKMVCLLSNSPSRIHNLEKKLASHFDIVKGRDYSAAHNSGEASYLALRDRADPFHARLGKNYYLIGLDIHQRNLEDLPYHSVGFDKADFLYVSRTFDLDEPLSLYDDMLRQAAKRGLPMLCANPDRTVGVGADLHVCAGAMAESYQALGGEVFYHGKPYSSVYDTVFTMMGEPPRSRVLAIGDGLPTDIRGGQDYGIDTALITDGIHKEDKNSLGQLYQSFGAAPTYTLSEMRWD